MADSADLVQETHALADVKDAIADLPGYLAPACSTTEGLTAARQRLGALTERTASLTPVDQSHCRDLLLSCVGTIFPNTTQQCLKATRNGTACQNQSSDSVGGLSCSLHKGAVFTHTGEGRGVRNLCCSPGCSTRLDAENLGCIGCTRGMCEDHYAAATESVPDAKHFQGVCSICLGQNPSLTELLFQLSNDDETNTKLLVFYVPEMETMPALCDHIEIYLATSPSHLVLDPHMQLHYPPLQATPVRRGRSTQPSTIGQTPSAPPPRAAAASLGVKLEAGTRHPAPGAPPAGAGFSVAAPADQTTQERLDALTHLSSNLSLNPQMTVTELIEALRHRQGSSAADLRGRLPHVAAGVPSGPNSGAANLSEVTQLLATTHLASNNLHDVPGTISTVHPSFSKVIQLLRKADVHSTGDLEGASDVLGLGPTKQQQLVNHALHGRQRADSSDSFHNTPGKMSLVYDHEEGQTVATSSQTERGYPTAPDLAKWGHTCEEFFRQLRLWREGIFHPGHPHYGFAKEMIDLHAGVNIFIHTQLGAHMMAGLTFSEAYMACVFFFQEALQGISKATGSELQRRMVAIGQADPVTQHILASHTNLFINSTPYTAKAILFVQGSSATKKGDKGKGAKPDRENPRERPAGACSLCGKSNCGGYFAPGYLCTNAITVRCRQCNFLHARTGRRKSPCGAPEPAAASE